jgi:hypothetical protein
MQKQRIVILGFWRLLRMALLDKSKTPQHKVR